MLLSAEFVLVKEITSTVPRSNFSDTEIEKLAQSILTVEGLIRPIVVRPTGIDTYEVVDGDREYHAAVRAREIDGRKGERITAIVIEGPKAEAIQEQVKLLNEIESTQEQLQETAQKIDTVPVTAEPEKVNLYTAKKEDIRQAFKRNGIKWTHRVWDAIAYWQNPGKTLSWANIRKSAKSGPHKIGGFGMGTIKNLRRVGYIPV